MKKEQQVEKVYQKLSQIEHILKRPDTYVGSIEKTEANLWVKPDNLDRFELRKFEYIPGLYKIFDEIIVNAADNYQRDNSMNLVKANIDRNTSEISVFNNGKSIPIVIHKEHNIYIPEMIFGHLLTGYNFNDEEKKLTGGRNGFGAKLTNIFSTKFVVETADQKTGKKFKMTWGKNMSQKSEPEIKDYNGTSYTKITFIPDLKRFGIDKFDDNTYALFVKRVYDLTGVINESVRVYFNDAKIEIKGFKDYVNLYFKKEEIETIPKIGYKSDRWEIVLVVVDDQFQQVSFVNSICTSGGGTHVTAVIDQVVNSLTEEIKKKHKKLEVKPVLIRNNFWVFLNCLIENPAFSSQTKEVLTNKPSTFGSKPELDDKFLKKLLKLDILEQIIRQAQAKENLKMQRTLKGTKKSKLLGINKLEDANLAGTKDSEKCLLILTEGDSAKSLAMAGMEVVGRDRFGVFPLKGKLLNVRDAVNSQITNNEEIQNIMKIIGLDLKKNYENCSDLRYGGIMIMTDQDVDGSHIKGLIINFISHFWPSLLKMNGFLKEFITPIIKASKGSSVISFYTLTDYRRWKEEEDRKGWKIKYYKGLGTSTDKEAREYFSEIDRNRINFKYIDKEDDDKIELAFAKKNADHRKIWLSTYDENIVLDHSGPPIRYKDFIDKELIHFSVYDNMRSIPSMVDGLKPGQRKILFGCFKRNLTGEMKVAQLSGYIAEHSAYHHGEVSLQQTIVGLAQNFVGSNNINLLDPIGQFGTRANGGKDAASARYIHTALSKITRFIFDKRDDSVLNYLNDDGQWVEPSYYVPIIPMVLVNGAEGIGTGWSTTIPCFSPHDIVDNLLNKLNGKEFVKMSPSWRGFNGPIEVTSNGVTIKGLFEMKNEENILEITELPLGKWTRPYKSYLEELMTENPIIDDFREYHTTQNVLFQIKLKEGAIDKLSTDLEIEKKFKLSTTFSNSNYVLFDKNGIIKRYENEIGIMNEFFILRLEFYDRRKQNLMSTLIREISILENKSRFIIAIIEERIKIRNVPKKEVLKQLIDQKFCMMKNMPKIKNFMEDREFLEAEVDVKNDSDEDERDEDGKIKEYNYLLTLSIWSLSLEQVEKLKNELNEKKEELNKLQKYDVKDMWRDDLQNFIDRYDELVREEDEARRREDEKLERLGKGRKGMKPMKPAKKKATTSIETISKTSSVSSDKVEKIKKPVKDKNVKNQENPKLNAISEEPEISALLLKDPSTYTLREKILMVKHQPLNSTEVALSKNEESKKRTKFIYDLDD